MPTISAPLERANMTGTTANICPITAIQMTNCNFFCQRTSKETNSGHQTEGRLLPKLFKSKCGSHKRTNAYLSAFVRIPNYTPYDRHHQNQPMFQSIEQTYEVDNPLHTADCTDFQSR